MKYVFVLLMFVVSTALKAGVFGEHKLIGDRAFARLLKNQKVRELFQVYKSVFLKVKDFKFPEDYSDNFFLQNPDSVYILKVNDSYGISYGDLTGLSGDHSDLPQTIFSALLKESMSVKYSKNNSPPAAVTHSLDNDFLSLAEVMETRLKEHHNALLLLKKSADNDKINTICLAYEDEGHFYDPSKSFDEQLSDASDASIFSKHIDDPDANKDFLREHYFRLNAIAKYTYMHILACYYATSAGGYFHDKDTSKAMHMLSIALLYNAFGDHFLQDSFAAGHIVTKRSRLFPLDNRGKHNYYNRTGLEVENLNLQRWRTYGDNFYNAKQIALAVEADFVSLSEVWTCFEASSKGVDTPDILLQLTLKKKEEIPGFFRSVFESLCYIPVPEKTGSLNHVNFSTSRNGLVIGTGIQKSLNDGSNLNIFELALGAGYIIMEPDYSRDIETTDFARESVFYLEFLPSLLLGNGYKPGFSFSLNSVTYDWLLLGIGYSRMNGRHSTQFRLGGDFKHTSWFFGITPFFQIRLSNKYFPVYSIGTLFKIY